MSLEAMQHAINESGQLTSAIDLRVLMLLGTMAGVHDDDWRHTAWPSNRYMAERLGVDERSIRRATKSLVDKGIMLKEERPGQSNLYVLVGEDRSVPPPSEGGGQQLSGGGGHLLSSRRETEVKTFRTTTPPTEVGNGDAARPMGGVASDWLSEWERERDADRGPGRFVPGTGFVHEGVTAPLVDGEPLPAPEMADHARTVREALRRAPRRSEEEPDQ